MIAALQTQTVADFAELDGRHHRRFVDDYAIQRFRRHARHRDERRTHAHRFGGRARNARAAIERAGTAWQKTVPPVRPVTKSWCKAVDSSVAMQRVAGQKR